MKIYEVIDEENSKHIGTLLYYEKIREFIIELSPELDEWTSPLLFMSYVKYARYTISREDSMLWVRERVIPSNRQNIGDILNTHKLKEYDEMKLLELSNGRCSQDSMYIKKIDRLPDYVSDRQSHNVCEVVALSDRKLLILFIDGSVRKISLGELLDQNGVDKVAINDALFESVKVGVGGYSITFNDSIDIPASMLYSRGALLPISVEDMKTFVVKNVMDTTQGCEMLECSRQNLAYMISTEQLHVVKPDVKGNLYFKGNLVSSTW